MTLDFSKVPGLEPAEVKVVEVETKSNVTATIEPAVAFQTPDLEAVKKEFAIFDHALEAMTAEAEQAEVKDEGTAAKATEMMAEASGFKKAIDAKRREFTDPAYKYFSAVNSFVKPYTDKLEKMIKILKGKYGEWSHQVEMQRREAEKKAQDAAAKKQREINQAAKKAGIDPVTMPTPVLPTKQEPVRTASGTASTKFDWEFEVIDFSKLPDNYKMVNAQALRAAKKAGIKDIPGTRRKDKPVVSVRSR
jgi:hypothetical protein